MKLYTENQLITSYNKGLREGKNNVIDSNLLYGFLPIELPSYEEASERLYPIKNTGSMFMPNLDEINNIYKQEGFMEGAKWVINHIKQQDNDKI